MAIIPNSLGITGPIAPLDSADRYPTHIAKYGKGGFYSVPSYENLGEISSDRLGNGEPFIYVVEEGKWYLYLDSQWVEVTFSNNESCCTILDYDADGDEIVTFVCAPTVVNVWTFNNVNVLNNVIFT